MMLELDELADSMSTDIAVTIEHYQELIETVRLNMAGAKDAAEAEWVFECYLAAIDGLWEPVSRKWNTIAMDEVDLSVWDA